MTIKEKALAIIEHYGVMPQLKYMQTEMFELIEAIINYEYDEKYEYNATCYPQLKEHIIEELADVTLMLKQFQEYYKIKDEEIKEVMNFKADRQLTRIAKEVEEENR